MYLGIKTTYSGGTYLTATGSNGKQVRLGYDFKYSRRENHVRAAGFFIGRCFALAEIPIVASVEWKDHYHHTVEVPQSREVQS